MPYLIDATDASGKDSDRERLRPDHLAYLEASLPLLLAAGAKLSDDGEQALGSAYIVDVETRAEAEVFIAGDPFHAGGLFGSVTITRWRKGFFDHARISPTGAPR